VSVLSPASLDAPIGDDDSTEFGDVIGDEEAQTPFELLRDKNLRGEVDDLIAALDSREKKIISQRFGLDGGKPKTPEDISRNFGVTRERIRQLQNIALAKLRRALSKKEDPLKKSSRSQLRKANPSACSATASKLRIWRLVRVRTRCGPDSTWCR